MVEPSCQHTVRKRLKSTHFIMPINNVYHRNACLPWMVGKLGHYIEYGLRMINEPEANKKTLVSES